MIVSGAMLRVRRELMGMSTNKVGDKLAVSGRTVQRWEAEQEARVPDAAYAMFDAIWQKWLRRVNEAVDVIEDGGDAGLELYRSPLVLLEERPGEDITWPEAEAFVKAVSVIAWSLDKETPIQWVPEFNEKGMGYVG